MVCKLQRWAEVRNFNEKYYKIPPNPCKKSFFGVQGTQSAVANRKTEKQKEEPS